MTWTCLLTAKIKTILNKLKQSVMGFIEGKYLLIRSMRIKTSATMFTWVIVAFFDIIDAGIAFKASGTYAFVASAASYRGTRAAITTR